VIIKIPLKARKGKVGRARRPWGPISVAQPGTTLLL
jgi:hypothetical protein